MPKTISKWIALIILLTAPLLSVIDVFIINIAIPAIKNGVHATDAELQLVIAGYLLGYASFLITGGRAGDHFGRKKIFFLGMLFFTVTSCLCGLSNTALQLNITRFFQGCSASFMLPQVISYIQILFPDPKERAKAIGWYGITLGLASIIGQLLGGYLSGTHFEIEGWRLIFFINLPIGIMALLATWKYLDETEVHNKVKFDYSGVVLLTLALVCLIYPIIAGREAGWPLWSLILLGLSLILFAYFIQNQKQKLKSGKSPLINIELFKIKDFNIGLGAVLFHFMMHTSYLLTAAVFFQNGLGISALDAGLYFVAPGILVSVSALISSKLIVRFGKRVLQAGVVLLLVSFLLQLWIFKPGVSSITIILIMGLYGLGNGLVLSSLMNITLRSIPSNFAGAASGVYATFQQTASALGISIIGGLFYAVIEPVSNPAQTLKAFDYATSANILCLLMVGFMLYILPTTKQEPANISLKKATTA